MVLARNLSLPRRTALRLGSLQVAILDRLHGAAKVKPTSKYYQHATSYAYVVYPFLLEGQGSASALSRAIRLMVEHGLIERTTVGVPPTFFLDGKKRWVQGSLLNQYSITQEILYLTDSGVTVHDVRSEMIEGSK